MSENCREDRIEGFAKDKVADNLIIGCVGSCLLVTLIICCTSVLITYLICGCSNGN